jgi:hypothetical protein
MADANGLGFTKDKVIDEVRRMGGCFVLSMSPRGTIGPDGAGITWSKCPLFEAGKRRQAFDAHLAAVMMESGLDCILTSNVDDFRRYPGVTAVNPQSVVAPRVPLP